MSNPYDNASDKVSVLGPTLKFKGELTADEDLMLKGHVEGSIRHTASLRIGEEGSVKGNTRAKYITVEGTVEGDLHAGESITIKESANVTGNVYSPTVSLIEGARLKGMVDMDGAPAEEVAGSPAEDASVESDTEQRKRAAG